MFFLFYNSLFADVTIKNVYFTDYEENATLYFVNYYPYQDFIDIRLGSSDSRAIVRDRPFTSLTDLADNVSMSTDQYNYLRQASHLVDWNVYTDDFGMTLHQTNFTYAILGTLVGFTFLLGVVAIILL